MANVNVAVQQLNTLGGTSKDGYKVGLISGVAKAAQNDTITITNAKVVKHAIVSLDLTGASETRTLATNVITLTADTDGTISGIVIYN